MAKAKGKKSSFSIVYIFIFLAVLYIIQTFLAPKSEEISYSQFRLYLKSGNISDCTVSPTLIRGHYQKLSAEGGKEEKNPLCNRTDTGYDLVNELESQKVRFKGAFDNNFLKNFLMWWAFPLASWRLAGFSSFERLAGQTPLSCLLERQRSSCIRRMELKKLPLLTSQVVMRPKKS